MPRTYAWKAATSGLTYVFDIDSSVGANASNRRVDVLLIQFMLATWMANDKDPSRRDFIIRAPVVKIDGVCGPKTIGAIRFLEEAFPGFVNDGKVDPLTTVSGKGHKLQLLNELMSFAGVMKGRVPENPFVPFPAELIPLLFRP